MQYIILVFRTFFIGYDHSSSLFLFYCSKVEVHLLLYQDFRSYLCLNFFQYIPFSVILIPRFYDQPDLTLICTFISFYSSISIIYHVLLSFYFHSKGCLICFRVEIFWDFLLKAFFHCNLFEVLVLLVTIHVNLQFIRYSESFQHPLTLIAAESERYQIVSVLEALQFSSFFQQKFLPGIDFFFQDSQFIIQDVVIFYSNSLISYQMNPHIIYPSFAQPPQSSKSKNLIYQQSFSYPNSASSHIPDLLKHVQFLSQVYQSFTSHHLKSKVILFLFIIFSFFISIALLLFLLGFCFMFRHFIFSITGCLLFTHIFGYLFLVILFAIIHFCTFQQAVLAYCSTSVAIIIFVCIVISDIIIIFHENFSLFQFVTLRVITNFALSLTYQEGLYYLFLKNSLMQLIIPNQSFQNSLTDLLTQLIINQVKNLHACTHANYQTMEILTNIYSQNFVV